MRKTNVVTVMAGALVLLAFAAVYALELRNYEARDFGSFWASGNAVRHQLEPYAVYPLTWRVKVRPDLVSVDPNLSPPSLLPVFSWTAHWNPQTGVMMWTYASFLAVVASALLIALSAGRIQPYQLLWMMLAPAVLHTVWLGQDYTFLMLLSALAWLCFRDGRYAWAGVCLGLICAAKPNFLLWPVLLLLARHRRSSLSCILTFSALSTLPILLYGPHIYASWLHAVSLTNHSIFPTDVSLMGYAQRLGARLIGTLLAAILAIAVCFWTYKRRPDIEAISGVAICAGILCSPLAWFHYTILLMPWMAARRWNRSLTVSTLLLMVPLDLTMNTTGRTGWPALYGGAPYFLAIVSAMICFVKQSYCVEISIIGRPVEPVFPPTNSLPSNVSRIM